MDSTPPIKVIVELPFEAVVIDDRSVGELAINLRLLWIIDRIRVGRISAGKGAELGGWIDGPLCGRWKSNGVALFTYSADDIRQDVATLESL